jgi:ABC-type lipoprotein export system ATPase subunit
VSPGRHSVPEPDDSFFAGESDGTYFDVELDVPEHSPRHAPRFEHRPLVAGSVHADAVSYARAGRTILDSVSVSVAPGEALAVVGPSGSGKSSLLALLAGLEPPDSGSVRRDRDGTPGPDGLVLQGYGLVSVLTAAENVEAPLQAGALGRLGRGEVRQRAAAALDSVGLTEVADHLVEELSGGQQQRAAVARALAIDPVVLFADELTAELDHEWKARVVELVLGVAGRGGIVVLATHDPEIAARCDHRLHLVDGRVAQLT